MEEEWRLIMGRLETFAAQVYDGLQQADFHTRREIIRSLGRVDALFDDKPRGHQMNEGKKGLAQLLIPRGNATKLFELVQESFHLLP